MIIYIVFNSDNSIDKIFRNLIDAVNYISDSGKEWESYKVE